MENCKHERCEWVPSAISWYFEGFAVDFCPFCGAKLTAPKPPVMTLEEVAAEIDKAQHYFLVPLSDRKFYARWHRAITAHIDGERDLKAKERVLYDIHDSLGIKWGDDPYSAIAALKGEPRGLTEYEYQKIRRFADSLSTAHMCWLMDIADRFRATKGGKQA